MPFEEYKKIITDFLAVQEPPVALADDNEIWIVVKVAHGQGRGAIWMATLALTLARSQQPDHELLQVK